MIYREAGQFKTSYQADNQIFPIRQDRLALTATLLVAVFLLPYFASPYMLSAILIPFLMEHFNIIISQFDVVAAGICALLVICLALLFSKTKVGRALRAVADDHQAALAVGIPLQRIWAVVWGVAGLVAMVAGLLWGARNGVQFALTFIALKALPVLILGGFTSVPGAIVGGLIIGASEKLAEVYLGPMVGGGIEGWFPYVLALLFLLVRPEGLFGEKIIRRI